MTQRVLSFVLLLLIVLGVSLSLRVKDQSSSTPVMTKQVNVRTCLLRPRKSIGKVADRRCSPGLSTSDSQSEICKSGYATEHRNVLYAAKLAVYHEYGIYKRAEYGHPGSYEIDHLVPLELGGSNMMSNLWPEPFPDFIAKDHMENYMHDQVCYHGLKLKSAQLFFTREYVR